MRFAAILLVLVPAEALTITRRHSFGLGAAGAAALGPALPAAAVREGSTKSGLRFRVEVEGSGDTPKRGQQALLDYVPSAADDFGLTLPSPPCTEPSRPALQSLHPDASRRLRQPHSRRDEPP